MTDQEIRFFKKDTSISVQLDDEPSTCTDAEPFALRVMDDSMEPEFREGCIIIIDPTGRATDGSFVLAEKSDSMLFRQLKQSDTGWNLQPLNARYTHSQAAADLSDIVGVIVQRAGTRRKYHKSYD